MNITIGTGSEAAAAAAATGLQRIASDDEIGPFTSLMRLIFKNILMHICLTLGLMGNILTLIVLLEKRMRRASTTQYLAALTLFDSLYLIGSFINNIQLNYPNTKESNLIPFFNLLFLPLTDFSGNTSAYLILMFTIERYLAVAYPLKSRYWCHPSRARKIIGITIFFCFLFTFPTFLESKIEIRWETTVNRTVVELTETNIYPHYYTFVYFWFISVTFQIIPLTLLIILNSILMKYIHKSMTSKKQCTSFETTQEITTANNNDKKKNFIVKKFKKFPTENLSEAKTINDNQTDRSRRSSFDMNTNTNNNEVKKNRQPNIQLRCNAVNQQSEQNKATLLLVATVLVFLVCQLPGAILLIYQAMPNMHDKNKISQDIILGLNNIANGLVAINASINFVLYSCFSEKFRLTFKRLFLTKKLNNLPDNRTNIEATAFIPKK